MVDKFTGITNGAVDCWTAPQRLADDNTLKDMLSNYIL